MSQMEIIKELINMLVILHKGHTDLMTAHIEDIQNRFNDLSTADGDAEQASGL